MQRRVVQRPPLQHPREHATDLLAHAQLPLARLVRSRIASDHGTDPLAATAGLPSTLSRPTPPAPSRGRSEEHTSELQSLTRISYAVCRLNKKMMHKNA